MAQRRMMSDKVIKTDSFMEMPHSTKNLYFYLMIEADDDGFVSNPKTIIRMVNAVDDDYKILIGKRFVVPFESGVCVIKHWLIHNLIRADRKVDTQWAEEKKLLIVDPDTQKYSLNKGLQPNDNQVSTKCPHRLGKVSIGKVSIGKQPTSSSVRKPFATTTSNIAPTSVTKKPSQKAVLPRATSTAINSGKKKTVLFETVDDVELPAGRLFSQQLENEDDDDLTELSDQEFIDNMWSDFGTSFHKKYQEDCLKEDKELDLQVQQQMNDFLRKEQGMSD
jgi:hypothetical protein